MGRLDRAIGLTLAALIAVLGFLPLANWIPGGHEAPWYGLVWSGWLSGGAIVAGVGVVVGILVGRRRGLWEDRTTPRAPRRYLTIWLIPFFAGAGYAAVAFLVFSGKPLLIDEIIQLFQARLYASGRLWAPAPEYPEFFSAMHLIDTGGKVYGQFPAGGPLMMVPGVLLGAEWLTGPLFGAVSVALAIYLFGLIESRTSVRWIAALVFAFAPFALLMSGSLMNHVTVLTWILVGMTGLARVTQGEGSGWRAGAVTGLGFGLAAMIRPVDAFAFGFPAGVWLALRAFRRGRWAELLAAGLGIALPVAGLLWINLQTTGAPLRFGYTVMWGAAHDLGFHATPWGAVHTPLRGLELLNLYFLRLQTYFLEAPVPSLLPAGAALFLARRLSPFDRYLLGSSALLAALYFGYWHDGFYLGPRFMYPLLPALALWTARCLPAIWERAGPGRVYAGAVAAAVTAVLLSLGVGLPMRIRELRQGMLTSRWDADRAAAAAGVRGALVLVRESWGAQVITGLWRAGIGRADAEQFYRHIGTCELEAGLERLQAHGVAGPAAADSIRKLLVDSGRVQWTRVSPDPTERVLAGALPSERCRERLAEDWQGFTTYGHLILAGRNGNLFAKDLHALDTLLLQAYPDRPVFLLKPPTVVIGAAPMFYPVSRDSIWNAARRERSQTRAP